MSTPIGTPPSILHINLGGASLVVPPRSEECFIAGMAGEPGVETRYKLTKIKDFLDEGGLAVCVAEAGVTGDTVSEGLRAALEPHRVFQHGAKSGILNHSVMMVINMGQKVGRVIRDPQRSGRAMAVDLIGPGGRASRGKQKIFRIAELYLPSGLDGTVGIIPANTAWTSKGALRRIEADRLARLTNKWSQGLEMMVVMGDLNETYRKQDRLSAVGSLNGAPKGAPTLSRMLNHGFVDLFPLARKEEKGWTSFRADGAKSRIDYGLASSALAGWLSNHPDSWDCFPRHRWRDRVETGMTGHYHAALQVDLPREVWGLAMPLQRKFKRNWVNMSGVPNRKKLKIAKLVQSKLEPMIPEVTEALRHADVCGTQVPPEQWRKQQGKVLESLQKKVLGSVNSVVDEVCPRKRRRKKEFSNNFRAISLAWRVCNWLDRGSGNQSCTSRLRKALNKTSYQDNRWVPPDLSRRWSKWTMDVLKFMKHPEPGELWKGKIRTEAAGIQAAFKANRSRMREAGGSASDRVTRLFDSGPRGRGEALRILASEAASSDLSSVREADGQIIRDPAIYVEKAADIVAAPFSLGIHIDKRTGEVSHLRGPGRHHLKPRHWQRGSYSVVARGRLPEWWAEKYRWGAKREAVGKFTNLTTRVSTDEAWSQVRKSKSGTAPGHDYRVLKGDLSDHLPVLQNAPTTAALVILTALVNMGLCLAMVTPFMKLGLVTMTPKVMLTEPCHQPRIRCARLRSFRPSSESQTESLMRGFLG